jgi:hypothetical protein
MYDFQMARHVVRATSVIENVVAYMRTRDTEGTLDCY